MEKKKNGEDTNHNKESIELKPPSPVTRATEKNTGPLSTVAETDLERYVGVGRRRCERLFSSTVYHYVGELF
ncbi:hypothetical protein TKK_0003882 [Trichogramma kaykai]